MLQRDQAGEDLHAACRDGEVVVAAAEALAAVLGDAQAPPLGPVLGCHPLQVDNTLGDAVDGLVHDVGGEVVEHQHGGPLAGEVVLERQDLPAVAQGVAGEQPDLRQAVEHDAGGLARLDRLQDGARALAEFEVGGVEQALLLTLLEQALGRHEFENRDLVVEVPAVGGGVVAQLLFGFREGDVEAGLAGFSALEQELQRDRGLARPRVTLEQVEAVAGEAAAQDVVEAGDAEQGLPARLSGRGHGNRSR